MRKAKSIDLCPLTPQGDEPEAVKLQALRARCRPLRSFWPHQSASSSLRGADQRHAFVYQVKRLLWAIPLYSAHYTFSAISKRFWRGLKFPFRHQQHQHHSKRFTKALELQRKSVSLPNLSKKGGNGKFAGFFSEAAQRLLLNRVGKSDSLASILRNGNSKKSPFLAFAAVGLGSGLISKDDAIEGVCSEIRHAAGKVGKVCKVCDDEDNNEVYADEVRLSDLEMGSVLAKGCNAVVCGAKWIGNAWTDVSAAFERIESGVEQEPLAVKMMFNYEAESNALSIMAAMHRETVPARKLALPPHLVLGQAPRIKLPPHNNIVDMPLAFTDQVPELKDGLKLFPQALPRRLNPDGGLGRNMSLFLVMKKYECSVREYLSVHSDGLNERTALLMLTQLMEGVVHMTDNGIAHRDLKTDNLLLEFDPRSKSTPQLVVSDFGCCLTALKMSFPSWDVSLGGNAALMAPEISKATPGPFNSVDYGKSDLWSVATIAYELFGGRNPFYDVRVSSRSYGSADELPKMPSMTPTPIQALVRDLLNRDPRKRVSAEIAANICQLLLWAPKKWFDDETKLPKKKEILEWLLALTTKLLCEARFNSSADVEYKIVAVFLSRLSMERVREAILWIRQNY